MNKIKIGIITIFPEIFKSFLTYGLLGKAIKKNIINIILFDLKKFSINKVDDYAYGGGGGMVIKCNPIYNSIIESKKKIGINSKIIYLSPQGKIINQKKIKLLSNKKSLILICGRYEGVDERIIKYFIDEEISIGDYILSGGEIPSMVLIDSISRLIPGVIKNKNSIKNESFNNGLLDHPNFTKPRNFMNFNVPSILLSGNHNKILKWRLKHSLGNTWIKRPDLINKKVLNNEELKLLKSFKKKIIKKK